MAGFKQAGFDINDSLTLTKDAMDLVIAGGVDTAQASDLIVASLKGFGEGAGEAGRLLDILNETSNNYATSVEQLATGMAGISPIAKQMGFSMEETAGVLTPVIEIFRSGDTAATALKTGLLKLIDDSKPVADALKSIGVSQKDANGELRSGKDIYKDVAIAFKDLDENQKLFVTSQLVGLEQSAKMVTVFDNLALSTEITEKAMNSAGSAALEVAAQLDTSEKAVDKFKTSFENLSVSVGDQFSEAAKEAVDGGAELFQAIRALVEGGTFDPIFDEIEAIAEKLGETLSGIAGNLPEAMKGVDFSGLIDSFKNVGESLGMIFDDVDLSTPEGLAEVIQLLIDGLTALANTTAGIADGFGPFIEGLSEFGKIIADLDGDTLEFVGTILALGTAFGTVGGLVVAGGAFVSGLGTLAGLVSTGGALSTGLAGIVAVLSGPVGLAAAIGAATVAIASLAFDQVEKDGQALISSFEAQAAAAKDLTDQIKELPIGTSTIDIFTAIETGDLESAQDMIDLITTEEYIANIGTEVDSKNLDYYLADVSDIFVDVGAEVDTDSVKEATETITYELDGVEYTLEIPVEASGVEKVKEDIEEIPTEKQIEIQLQGDIDTQIALITSSAETAQAAFKYTAEVDIAKAQAASDVLKSAFDGAAASVESLSSSTSDMFGSLLSNYDKLSKFDQGQFTRMAEEQQDAQNAALASQIELNDATIANLNAKTDAFEAGDAAITIDSTGLEPALEMVMFEILKKVQVRVNETAGDLLLT